MCRLLLGVVALLMACATGASAQKEVRVALVIGNGAYQHAEPLKNPVNDARAMAKVLKDAGFEVILRENATRRTFVEALHEFAGKVPPGGVGLFYYAGHGLQVRGVNHLVPIDAALTNEYDVKYETVDVNDVLGRLDEARARLSLMILDACRDNPFARRFRSTGRGLAQTDAPRGTVIAYATAPGDTAADGDGANGLYTTELLKAITVPGLKLEEVFKRTIDGVARSSGNKQTPWVSSSFRGDFVFNAAIAPPPPPPPPPVSMPAPAPAPAPTVDTIEQTAWTTIASSSNPAMFELFLKRFPNGVYADFARARLEELNAARAADERQRSAATDEAKRRADAEARQVAAAEEARRRADTEEAKRKADADAKRTAADEARRKAEAEDAKRKADAEAKRAADEEARRVAAAEDARRRAAAEEEKKSVEGAEAALKLADIDRKRIQAALTAKGFDTLATDGAFGPRTRQMITNWQRSRSEPPTGYLTATQAALLSREGESALVKLEEERKKADEEKRKAEAERQKVEAERLKAMPPPPPQAAAPAPQQAVAPVTPAPPSPSATGIPTGAIAAQHCAAAWDGMPAKCNPISVSINGGAISGSWPTSVGPASISGSVAANGAAQARLNTIAPGGMRRGEPVTTNLSGRVDGGVLTLSGTSGGGRAHKVIITLSR